MLPLVRQGDEHAGPQDALQYFDFGSQNWAYADVNGNIAYYTSGEVPFREDLQDLFFPPDSTRRA